MAGWYWQTHTFDKRLPPIVVEIAHRDRGLIVIAPVDRWAENYVRLADLDRGYLWAGPIFPPASLEAICKKAQR